MKKTFNKVSLVWEGYLSLTFFNPQAQCVA